MTTRIALVHTVGALGEHFERLIEEVLPGAETTSVVTEHLLARTISDGELGAETSEELASIVADLRPDADAVLVTCSTLGPAVDALDDDGPPVLRVDEAMARQAVRAGRTIGVLATLSTTLEPTVDLLERVATEEGADVDVVSHLCHGAFEAVSAGDGDRHDEIVRAGLLDLAARVDVVVLAQASMARVVDSLDHLPTVPVLSSPRAAVEQLAAVLGER